jgi:hypothetical protein
MLALVIVGPLVSATPQGWIAIDIVESFVLVAAVARSAQARSPCSSRCCSRCR